MLFRKLYILTILFLVISCSKKESIKLIEEENTYQIISYLVDDYKKYLVLSSSFPPPPIIGREKFKTQDSLNIYKYFIQQSLKKKNIAVNKKLFRVEEKSSFRGKCDIVDDQLLEKFNNLKENKKLDVEKVTMYGKDTLIQYKEEFKKLPWSGFNEIDLLLNFSRIAFNKEYNKAIIIVGAAKGRLNGVSTLLYLEKENYVWKIKCQQDL